MTSRWGRIGPWVWVSLVLPVVIAGGIEFGVIADILSPAAWIDIVSVWPVAAVGLLAGPVVWLAAGRRPRDLAIPGLAVFSWLALGLALHVSASDFTPVSRASIVGPSVDGTAVARMQVDLEEGILDVSSGSDTLYAVDPIRAGGTVGAPTGFEQTTDDGTTVALVPQADPGLYVFRGWRISLASDVAWTIDLAADRISIDLHRLETSSVHLESETSEVRLGSDGGPSILELAGGRHRVYVARESPVTFRGQGMVPSDWTVGQDGTARSPAGGDGWTIVSSGDALVEIWYS